MKKQSYTIKDGKVTLKGVVIRKGQVWIRGETHLRISMVYPTDKVVTAETRVGTVGRYTAKTEKVALDDLARFNCVQAD